MKVKENNRSLFFDLHSVPPVRFLNNIPISYFSSFSVSKVSLSKTLKSSLWITYRTLSWNHQLTLSSWSIKPTPVRKNKESFSLCPSKSGYRWVFYHLFSGLLNIHLQVALSNKNKIKKRWTFRLNRHKILFSTDTIHDKVCRASRLCHAVEGNARVSEQALESQVIAWACVVWSPFSLFVHKGMCHNNRNTIPCRCLS